MRKKIQTLFAPKPSYIKRLIHGLWHKNHKKEDKIRVVLQIGCFLLAGILLAYLLLAVLARQIYLTQLKQYYQVQSEVYVDGFDIVNAIDKRDASLLLVDIRSPNEFKRRHIKGAVNVPGYLNEKKLWESRTTSQEQLKEFGAHTKGKKLAVIYGFSPQSKITMLVAANLLNKNLPVKLLNVSFYEWKNNYFQWLPEAAWPGFSVEPYLEPKEELLPVAPVPIDNGP